MYDEQDLGIEKQDYLFADDHKFCLPGKDAASYLCMDSHHSSELFQESPSPHHAHTAQHHPTPKAHPLYNLDIFFSSTSKNSYDHQTRQEKLDRYKCKKSSRVWRKKVSYMCRQDVAKHRPRVRGRFVSSKKLADLEGSPAQREETTLLDLPDSPKA